MKNEKNIKFEVFIKGDLVDLVVLTEEIVKKTNWYKWFNDEETTKNMQKHYFPNTIDLQLDYFKKNILNNKEKLQLGVVVKKENIFSGVISLSNIDYLNQSCEFAAIMGEDTSRSIKNFIEAGKLICKHAFENLNMQRVYSGSISKEIDDFLCRALGFTHEGIKRKAIYKNGKFLDVYEHSILKSEYKTK
jgi:RimJ/RimL family protein N-acetyltransferase